MSMITEKQLFDRLVELETQKLVIAEDIAQLKTDAKFDKEFNPQGIQKEDVAKIQSAAKMRAKEDFADVREKMLGVFAKYQELVGEGDE